MDRHNSITALAITDEKLKIIRESYSGLERVLKRECGRGPVYFIPNAGNWGDGVLRVATLKFLQDIHLKHKEMTMLRRDWLYPKLRGGTVIYGGGGAWCGSSDHSITCTPWCTANKERVCRSSEPSSASRHVETT